MSERRTIVKVQVSLESSFDRQRMLIYDEYQAFLWEGNKIPTITLRMGGEPKKFFWATIEENEGSLTVGFSVDEEAPWQEW